MKLHVAGFVILGLSCLCTPQLHAGTEIAVVVNKSSAVSNLNKAQLSAIYRAKTTEFPNGATVTALNLPQDNPIRHDFDKAVLGMSPDEVKRFWIDAKIRSGSVPPKRLGSAAAIAKQVAADPQALGYLPASDARGLKVVARVRNGEVTGP
jgi:ABC-type phosphate transport system substrate-binding protein